MNDNILEANNSLNSCIQLLIKQTNFMPILFNLNIIKNHMNLKSPVVLTNSKKENFSSDISVNSKLPTFNFLQKKSSRKTSSSSQAGNLRCDICLEYERYSQQELIECYECNAKFHKKCYDIENLNDEVKPKCGNFVCNRCEHASKLKMDYTSFQ